MKRWLLIFMFLVTAGGGITAAADGPKPEPDVDIYGIPPLCC